MWHVEDLESSLPGINLTPVAIPRTTTAAPKRKRRSITPDEDYVAAMDMLSPDGVRYFKGALTILRQSPANPHEKDIPVDVVKAVAMEYTEVDFACSRCGRRTYNDRPALQAWLTYDQPRVGCRNPACRMPGRHNTTHLLNWADMKELSETFDGQYKTLHIDLT